MHPEALDFLRALCATPSPSGFEQSVQKVFRNYLEGRLDELETDVLGNTSGLLRGRGKGPVVMLAGHCDEIGFMVKYIDDQGFLYFSPIGGVDEHLIPGKRVQIHSRQGPILGVVGRWPIHLIDPKDRDKVAPVHTLFIDFGAKSKKEAEGAVAIGDPITFAGGLENMRGDQVVSRGFDDKVGSFVVAEVLRRIAGRKERPECTVYGVSTVQEEIGLRGATTSAYRLQPEVGIAVEVGHTSDYPEVDKKRFGEIKLGAGPIINRGPNVNPVVFDLLLKAGRQSRTAVQINGAPRATPTDANVIQLSRRGVATGLVGVPLRYMHTPSEVLSLKDLEATCRLLLEFLYNLKEGMSFIPRSD